jgi:hypothetical protein
MHSSVVRWSPSLTPCTRPPAAAGRLIQEGGGLAQKNNALFLKPKLA